MLTRLLMNLLTIVILLVAVFMAGCAEKQEKPTPASEVRFDDIQMWINAFEAPDRPET